MSVTLEDVLYCHERNSLLYLNLQKESPVVYPITIGNNTIEKTTDYYYWATGQGKNGRTCLAKRVQKNDIYDNLKKKHYIKIGEECPICYEGIFHKRDAQLTDCGHCFHYSCLQNYSYLNKNIDTSCPICRDPLTGIDKNKYSSYTVINYFDILDDFWMNHKTNIPETCISFKTKNKLHTTGFSQNTCNVCRNFCKPIVDYTPMKI